MYRILICNDEKLEAKKLIRAIEKSDCGFEVCGVAADGLTALDYLKKFKPHLVFANIGLGNIDGLQLLKTSNDLNMHTLFVAMSNNAEFAEIKKAINCGAIGYCLNPFSDSDINEILCKAKHYIDVERAYAESELFSLISGTQKSDYKKIGEILTMYGLEWNDVRDITVMASRCEDMEYLLSGFNFIKLRMHHDKNAFIVNTSSLNSITKKIREAAAISEITVGISRPCCEISDLSDRITEASVAAEQPFMTGRSGIYYFRSLKNMDIKILIPRIQTIIKSKSRGKTLHFIEFVEQLFSLQDYSVIQACEFYNIMVSYIYQFNDDKCELIEGYEKLVGKFKGIGEELSFLRDLMFESSEIGQFKNRNQTFYCIIRYINENYRNDELSLQAISREFLVNSNYVSQLFKKETGMTFTEYLTKLRVKNAVYLLKMTQLPVCSVAEKSGFNDYFYFARIFKKYTGKSSTVYRELFQNVTYIHNEDPMNDVQNQIQSAIHL